MKGVTILLIAVSCAFLEEVTCAYFSDDLDDRGSADDDLGIDDEDGSGSGDNGNIPYSPVYRTSRVPDHSTSVAWTDTPYHDIDEEEEDVSHPFPSDILTHPAVLAAIIVGGVVLIIFIILLIMFIIYRMRKRDEGSYILDDPTLMIIGGDRKHPSLMYKKAPPNDHEFYA